MWFVTSMLQNQDHTSGGWRLLEMRRLSCIPHWDFVQSIGQNLSEFFNSNLCTRMHSRLCIFLFLQFLRTSSPDFSCLPASPLTCAQFWAACNPLIFDRVQKLCLACFSGHYEGTKGTTGHCKAEQITTGRSEENPEKLGITAKHESGRKAEDPTHNPKVVGSNPAPATIFAPQFWYKVGVHFHALAMS